VESKGKARPRRARLQKPVASPATTAPAASFKPAAEPPPQGRARHYGSWARKEAAGPCMPPEETAVQARAPCRSITLRESSGRLGGDP
jgi:hypothetical protein